MLFKKYHEKFTSQYTRPMPAKQTPAIGNTFHIGNSIKNYEVAKLERATLLMCSTSACLLYCTTSVTVAS